MKLFGRKINEYKINWKNNGQQKVKKKKVDKKEIYTCIDPGNSLIKKELVMKVKKKDSSCRDWIKKYWQE